MKLIPLEEAAEMLSITTEKLLEMRSANQIFGYRDGTTWKFKDAELDRVAGTLGVSMVDEGMSGASSVDLELASDTGSDSNILSGVDSDLDEMVEMEDSGLLPVKADGELSVEDDVLELGPADNEIDLSVDSDVASADASKKESSVQLGVELDAGSDLDLDIDSGLSLEVEDEGSGIDLEISDSEIQLDDAADKSAITGLGSDIIAADDGSELELSLGDSEISLAATSGAESSVKLDVDASPMEGEGSDFDFDLSDVDLTAGSDEGSVVAKGVAAAGAAAAGAAAAASGSGDVLDSDIFGADGSDLGLQAASDLDLSMSDSAIELDLDGDDDGGSSLNLDESGINLSSPADSGISLEGVPSELAAGSDVDALELGEADVIDLGDEAVDLEDATIMADNDFLLEPVEGDQEEVDSGSQIIALDTEEIAPDAGTLLTDDAFVETTTEVDPGLQSLPDDGGVAAVSPLGQAAGTASALEIPYTVWNIVGLSLCTMMLAIGGMMVADLVMNMWSWNGAYSLNSALMDSILGIFGM